MVVVNIKDPITSKIYNFYIDKKLKEQLDSKVKSALGQKDEDYLIAVDGEERAGKSTFAMQIGKYIDPSLSLDRVCFSPDEFRKAIINAEPGQCVIFDEAYRGLSAKGALTEVNRILVSLMMEMGQKNLFVIVVLPTFYLLEKYVALWRARVLFHIYRRNTQKGFWVCFNKKKKKLLYLKGKKDYGYGYVKSGFRGRFSKKYVIDEQEYRNKKAESLKVGYKTTKREDYLLQRDRLVYALSRELNVSTRELEKICNLYKVGLKKTSLGSIIKKITDKGLSSVFS